MKLIILACLAACACADVSHILAKNNEQSAQIQSQELDLSPEGRYLWSFLTDNGIRAAAKGDLTQKDGENVLGVNGEVSYTSPDGQPISLQYTADENGYRAQGEHLPTPHPIPEYILRALEYIKNQPPAVEN